MEHAQIPEVKKPKDDLHKTTDSPFHHVATPRRFSSDSPHYRQGDPLTKVGRATGGSDRSFEQSPLHYSQAKSPRERKGSSEGRHGIAPNTPTRMKTRNGGREDDSPDEGTAVPKFGEWDENDPATADGFTQRFNRVRAEKQTGSAKVPQINGDLVNLGSDSDGKRRSSICFCFSWCRK